MGGMIRTISGGYLVGMNVGAEPKKARENSSQSLAWRLMKITSQKRDG